MYTYEAQWLSNVSHKSMKLFMMKPFHWLQCLSLSNKLLGLSQNMYKDKVLTRFNMEEYKKGLLPMYHDIYLSQEIYLQIEYKRDKISWIIYTSVIGSIMYALLCIRG